jgi:hypothetical protein
LDVADFGRFGEFTNAWSLWIKGFWGLREFWVRECRGIRMSALSGISGISGSFRVLEFMISGGLDVGAFGCSGRSEF